MNYLHRLHALYVPYINKTVTLWNQQNKDNAAQAHLISFAHITESQRLTQAAILDRLRDLKGNTLPVDYLSPTADYYLFLCWGTSEGRLNKDHVKVWQDMAAAIKHTRIQVVLVNMDQQQWWEQ